MADLAELELAERRGSVVDADEARADVIAAYSLVKTRLLGVPSRLAQRVPDLAAKVVPVVDELIREALEELAADPRIHWRTRALDAAEARASDRGVRRARALRYLLR